MLLNVGIGEYSWESLGLQGDQTSPFWRRSVLGVHGRTDVEAETQYFGHLMCRADSFEKTLMLGKIEGRKRRDDRGWDGWMESLTQWTWVWVNSRSWWWTGKPSTLQFRGSQRVGHDWVTELNWTELNGISLVERRILYRMLQRQWNSFISGIIAYGTNH